MVKPLIYLSARLSTNCTVGGISNFFSLLIRSFGYTPQQSLLYGTPGGAVEIVALIVSGYLGDRLGQRILVSSVGLVIAIIGMIMIIAIPSAHPTGRLIGYYLTQASPTPFVALLSLIASNIAGYTKKTTVAALFLIGYCVGNIIGPQTFRGTDYVPAEITIICCWGACLFDLGFIWWWCRRENHRKEVVKNSPGYQKLENQVCLLRSGCEMLDTNFCDRNGLILLIGRILSLLIHYRRRTQAS
jgi:ACS family allantoate permease-like MFS transporter